MSSSLSRNLQRCLAVAVDDMVADVAAELVHQLVDDRDVASGASEVKGGLSGHWVHPSKVNLISGFGQKCSNDILVSLGASLENALNVPFDAGCPPR